MHRLSSLIFVFIFFFRARNHELSCEWTSLSPWVYTLVAFWNSGPGQAPMHADSLSRTTRPVRANNYPKHPPRTKATKPFYSPVWFVLSQAVFWEPGACFPALPVLQIVLAECRPLRAVHCPVESPVFLARGSPPPAHVLSQAPSSAFRQQCAGRTSLQPLSECVWGPWLGCLSFAHRNHPGWAPRSEMRSEGRWLRPHGQSTSVRVLWCETYTNY